MKLETHGSRWVGIYNRDLHYNFTLDLASKTYTATQVDERGVPVNPPPGPIERTEWKPSGRTQIIHLETIDTGERHKMFGYTARRVKTRQTITVNPPGDSSQTSTETDGWYIDYPPGLGGRRYAGVSYSSYGQRGERDEIRFTYGGRPETGLPIAVKSRYSFDRVIELSEKPLDPALFLPPPDFKQIAPRNDGIGYSFRCDYPWTMRVRLNWLMLTDFERFSRLLE